MKRDLLLEAYAGPGALLRAMGGYRKDLSVGLDGGSTESLEELLEGLEEARYRLCAWRLTA